MKYSIDLLLNNICTIERLTYVIFTGSVNGEVNVSFESIKKRQFHCEIQVSNNDLNKQLTIFGKDVNENDINKVITLNNKYVIDTTNFIKVVKLQGTNISDIKIIAKDHTGNYVQSIFVVAENVKCRISRVSFETDLLRYGATPTGESYLYLVDDVVERGDIIKIRGIDDLYKVTNIYPFFDMNGNIHHYKLKIEEVSEQFK